MKVHKLLSQARNDMEAAFTAAEGLLGGDNHAIYKMHLTWPQVADTIRLLIDDAAITEAQPSVELPKVVRDELQQFIRVCLDGGDRPYHDDFLIEAGNWLRENPDDEGALQALEWAKSVTTEAFNLAVQSTLHDMDTDAADGLEEVDPDAAAMVARHDAAVLARDPDTNYGGAYARANV